MKQYKKPHENGAMLLSLLGTALILLMVAMSNGAYQ